ncbi:hypothetical protein [Ekhidna sp.]|uniref:hypothetical protein n=1 Tax=Ekhidna sp. TaxID=2608089 RepID=UPI003C7972FF
MKLTKLNTPIKLLFVLTAFLFSAALYGQDSSERNTIRVSIIKHPVSPAFLFQIPYFSKVLIDSHEQLRLRSREYASIELEKQGHMISLPNSDPYSIDGDKNNYYFIILFRKRTLWRKHELIEVTEEYFNSIELEKYREYNSSDQIKWY